MVIPSADWINPSDWAILYFMDGHRQVLAVSPAVVAANIPVASTTAQRRLKVLSEAGLVEPDPEVESTGYYKITEIGQQYIGGELTREDVEALGPG